MQIPEGQTWFVGDLGDPWIREIADRLPDSTDRRDCPGDLPEAWAVDGPVPRTIVLHRANLTPTDLGRLARLRGRGESPARVVLCVGPHVRHDDLVRSARLFDAVLPEATAAETIVRHVQAGPRPALGRARGPVQVVSGLHDVRVSLGELCRHFGFGTSLAPDSLGLIPGELIVWDVPVLEPGWPDRLALWSRTARVVGLFGFADREVVRTARSSGASACLEWPVDLDDLAFVLDRVSATARPVKAAPGHVLPPPPRSSRRSRVVDTGRSA